MLRVGRQRVEAAAETERKIKEFEELTGLKFSDWSRDHIELAKTVKAALEGRYDKVEEKLEHLAVRAEKLAKYARGEEVSTWDI